MQPLLAIDVRDLVCIELPRPDQFVGKNFDCREVAISADNAREIGCPRSNRRFSG